MRQEIKSGKAAVIAGCMIWITAITGIGCSGVGQQDLPKLPEITIVDLRGEAAQLETYKAYEISQLVSGNPWTQEAQLTTLPVYKSREFNEEASLKTEAERIEKITIPEEIDFAPDSSEEEVYAVAEYLIENHGDVIQMESPQAEVCGGGYTLLGQQVFDIEMYETGADIEEQILNYHFDRVSVVRDEEEESLLVVKKYKADLAEKIGDYPIVSVEEATKLLKKGNYKTTALHEMPGEEYIGKVELVYRTGALVEYYIPYYCFYVELPDMESADGLKTFGTYYVPAVNKAYITNFPKWEPGLIP